MEKPDKLIADVNEAIAALAGLPDGKRLSMAVIHLRDLAGHLNLALEATTPLAEMAVSREAK